MQLTFVFKNYFIHFDVVHDLIILVPFENLKYVGIAVLLLTFDRPTELSRTLDSIFKIKPVTGYPVFVSQDGDNQGLYQLFLGSFYLFCILNIVGVTAVIQSRSGNSTLLHEDVLRRGVPSSSLPLRGGSHHTL